MEIKKIRQRVKENIGTFAVIVGTTGTLAFIFYVSGIGCLIKDLLGIPCPGCGLTRAWIAFFKMDLREAFKWHPLFWLVPIIMIAAAFMKDYLFKNKRTSLTFWIIIGILVLGVYIIRMLNMFPNQAPMDYNKHALVYEWIHLNKTQVK